MTKLDPTQSHVFEFEQRADAVKFLLDNPSACLTYTGNYDNYIGGMKYSIKLADVLLAGLTTDDFPVTYTPPAQHPLQGLLDEIKEAEDYAITKTHSIAWADTIERYIKENPVNE